MFAFKKQYFLIIESIKDIDLRNIKKRNKFIIIYRNLRKIDELSELIKFRKKCKVKQIKFYVANNMSLATALSSDGIYISSKNKDYKYLNYKKFNFKIIGSAHNTREIELKKKQGCNCILLSRLFRVSYKPKLRFLGINKFNNFALKNLKFIVPLGGIELKNLNKLKNVKAEAFAVMSEIKKKPAKIFSRLF